MGLVPANMQGPPEAGQAGQGPQAASHQAPGSRGRWLSPAQVRDVAPSDQAERTDQRAAGDRSAGRGRGLWGVAVPRLGREASDQGRRSLLTHRRPLRQAGLQLRAPLGPRGNPSTPGAAHRGRGLAGTEGPSWPGSLCPQKPRPGTQFQALLGPHWPHPSRPFSPGRVGTSPPCSLLGPYWHPTPQQAECVHWAPRGSAIMHGAPSEPRPRGGHTAGVSAPWGLGHLAHTRGQSTGLRPFPAPGIVKGPF